MTESRTLICSNACSPQLPHCYNDLGRERHFIQCRKHSHRFSLRFVGRRPIPTAETQRRKVVFSVARPAGFGCRPGPAGRQRRRGQPNPHAIQRALRNQINGLEDGLRQSPRQPSARPRSDAVPTRNPTASNTPRQESSFRARIFSMGWGEAGPGLRVARWDPKRGGESEEVTDRPAGNVEHHRAKNVTGW